MRDKNFSISCGRRCKKYGALRTLSGKLHVRRTPWGGKGFSFMIKDQEEWKRLFAFALLESYAGTAGAADNDGRVEKIRRGGVDITAGDYYLACLEYHLAGGVAYGYDLAVSFDVIAGIDGSEELDVVVSAEQSLVAVELYEKLGRDVSEKMYHVRAVNKVPSVMSVLCRHAETKR